MFRGILGAHVLNGKMKIEDGRVVDGVVVGTREKVVVYLQNGWATLSPGKNARRVSFQDLSPSLSLENEEKLREIWGKVREGVAYQLDGVVITLLEKGD